MKSLRSNIIWKPFVFILFLLFIIVSIYKYFVLTGFLDAQIFGLSSTGLFFIYILLIFWSISRKVRKPVRVLSENLQNALSSNWQNIKPMNSKIKEFLEIEQYSKYIFQFLQHSQINPNEGKLSDLEDYYKIPISVCAESKLRINDKLDVSEVQKYLSHFMI